MKQSLKPISFGSYLKENMRHPAYKKAYQKLDTDPDVILIEALAKARRQGLTQAQIARRMGTTQSAISRAFSPQGNPTLDFLRRFAEALNLNLKIDFV